MKTGTLKELNVKPGDVVEWKGNEYIAYAEPKPEYAGEVWAGTHQTGWIDGSRSGYKITKRATDTPTLWRDMTPEEKGALLLYRHELGELQRWYEGEWLTIGRWDAIYDHCAYRRKPEPKVEVERVTIVNADGITIGNGTVTTRNGKPDPASIKMEEL